LCSLEVGKKGIRSETDSVGDPGCLSRIPDLDFYPSRIQQLQQKEEGQKLCCPTLFIASNFYKIENYFFFEHVKKKIEPIFTQKIVIKLPKICVWDPGYGTNLFWIPDPCVK
jgi:hypothetical protein